MMNTTNEQELSISVEDVLLLLQVEAEWLRRNMFSTLAHAGNGPGARRYSRSRLRSDYYKTLGMREFAVQLIREHDPDGGIPDELGHEISTKLREAHYVAQGRNPDGTERTK